MALLQFTAHTAHHHDRATRDFCERKSPVLGNSLKGLATALANRLGTCPACPQSLLQRRALFQLVSLRCVLLVMGEPHHSRRTGCLCRAYYVRLFDCCALTSTPDGHEFAVAHYADLGLPSLGGYRHPDQGTGFGLYRWLRCPKAPYAVRQAAGPPVPPGPVKALA